MASVGIYKRKSFVDGLVVATFLDVVRMYIGDSLVLQDVLLIMC
jgi:hypothetical protein